LEAPLGVLDNAVRVNEQRKMPTLVNGLQLVRREVGLENCPLLDQAVRLPREALLHT
jgi:hypothetical protein